MLAILIDLTSAHDDVYFMSGTIKTSVMFSIILQDLLAAAQFLVSRQTDVIRFGGQWRTPNLKKNPRGQAGQSVY